LVRRASGEPQAGIDQSSAKEAGINLKFSDAQQKQEDQIKALRSYRPKVDASPSRR
jgi:hypothetical protein